MTIMTVGKAMRAILEVGQFEDGSLGNAATLTGTEKLLVNQSGVLQTDVASILTYIRNQGIGGDTAMIKQTFVQGPIFTGSISGKTLTVSYVQSGSLALGQTVYSDSTGANTTITSFGTGQGDIGTYGVSLNQTVAAESMAAANGGQFAPSQQTSLQLNTTFPSIDNILVFFDSSLQLDCSLSGNTLLLNPNVPQGVQQVTVIGGLGNVLDGGDFGAAMSTWLATLPTTLPSQPGIPWNNGGNFSIS